MTAVWQFLSRRQGKGGRLTLGDWLSYSYLVLGFLVIFLPVMWIVLNSFKSAFQLDKQDLSLLPTDFVRVARATVNAGIVLGVLPSPIVVTYGSLSQELKAP